MMLGIIILWNQEENKAQLFVYIDRSLTDEYDLNAGTLIREVAGQIKGGGGGQPFFASAGGKSPEGVPGAVSALKSKIEEKIASKTVWSSHNFIRLYFWWRCCWCSILSIGSCFTGL